MAEPITAVVFGAGVIGLTTATELLRQYPAASITVVARHLPGDQSAEDYCSSWAGANWISYDDNWCRQAAYEKTSFQRFLDLDLRSGVKRFPLRLLYDDEDIKLHGKEKLRQKWYRDIVGGLQEVKSGDLPAWAKLGLDMTTFMINPNVLSPVVCTIWQLLSGISHRGSEMKLIRAFTGCSHAF
jgi:glycine/D-amino acid oxidase-like deaminating enzyme